MRSTADEQTLALPLHPISNIGRAEIRGTPDGGLRITEVYGYTGSFRPNTPYPVVKTGIMDHVDMFFAIRDDDAAAAADAASRIQTEVFDVRIPFECSDNMKVDASITEKAFLTQINLAAIRASGKKVSVLNPSPGTITRLAKMGLVLDVCIVAGEYDSAYYKQVQTRVYEEKYTISLVEHKAYNELDPDVVYYCGFGADKAYHNGVKRFIGLSLNPHNFLCSGREFANSYPLGGCHYSNFFRDNYVAHSYYYRNVEGCLRYPPDVVRANISHTQKYKNFEAKVAKSGKSESFSLLWDCMTTVPLDWSMGPERLVGPPGIDIMGFSCDKVIVHKVAGYECVANEVSGGIELIDVKLPFGCFERRKVLNDIGHKHNIPVAVSRDVGFNYVLYPQLSVGIDLCRDSVRVRRIQSTTSLVSRQCENKTVIHPDLIRCTDGGVALRKTVTCVQAAVFEKSGDVWYMHAAKSNDRKYKLSVYSDVLPEPGDNSFDFIRRSPKKAKNPVSSIAYFDLLASLKLEKTCVESVVRGCFPDFGRASAYDFVSGGQSYVRSAKGDVYLIEDPKGDISEPRSGKCFFVNCSASYSRSYGLSDVAASRHFINKDTYMTLAGKICYVSRTAINFASEAVDEAVYATSI